MNQSKIIRTICYFTDNPTAQTHNKIQAIAGKLEDLGYQIQTKRVCTTLEHASTLSIFDPKDVSHTSVGAVGMDALPEFMPEFLGPSNISFNIDLSNAQISAEHTDVLFNIIRDNPSKTFNFTYTFNNAPSSPYFPSAVYVQNGFAIGLQPTNLAVGCDNIEDWLANVEQCWYEINQAFSADPEYLGIDSSIAPIGGGDSSFVHFINRISPSFSATTTTDIYTRITKFIKTKNPKPVGLCGLMLPCLEDDALTVEYENGNFTIERNIYLSLHSGLGIDTYPIGTDENPNRVVEILTLIQALSNKYSKPLSARFVSDGKAKIGDKTDFQNQYLADCTILQL